MSDAIRQCYRITFDKIDVPERLQESIEQMAQDQDEMVRGANDIYGKDRKYNGFGLRRKKSVLAVVLITVAVLGAAAVYAAVSGLWSRGLTGLVRSDPEEQQTLIDSGFAVPLGEENRDLAVTCNGVTITPNMVLTDGKVAYISFLIDGYDHEIEKDERPVFADGMDSPIMYFQDAKDPNVNAVRTYRTGFYSDLVTTAEGKPVYSDGAPAEINPDGTPVGRYKDENGRMEYIVRVMTTGGKAVYDLQYGNNWETPDSLYGTEFHIEFRDLGTTKNFGKIVQEQAAQGEPEDPYLVQSLKVKNVVEGTWTFDITMPEQNETAEYINVYELNKQLEDTDCFIQTVKISPISVELIYTVSKPKNKRGGDNTFELKGFILKDGTVVRKTTWDQPLILYGDTEEQKLELFTLDRVTDPEQVAALLVNLYAYSDEIEIRLQ